MTAPNPAATAQPGWRGTDPDGGTWVLTTTGYPWWYVSADGKTWGFRSQEEAEAAGLVRLIPAVGYHYDERGEDVVPDDEAQTRLERNPQAVEAIQQAEKDLAEGRAVTVEVQSASGAYLNKVDASVAPEYREVFDSLAASAPQVASRTEVGYITEDGEELVKLSFHRAEVQYWRTISERRSPAPAPLDPGNPEHLREVDKFLGRFYASIGIASSSAGSVCKQLRSVADRLDREQREAEQEVAEEAFVQGIYERWCASDGTDHDLIREAIRAERARQEAGQ